MIKIGIYFVVVLGISFVSSDDLRLDPLVFDYKFYLNTYGDLLVKNITWKSPAQEHWLKCGMGDDRFGTSFFQAASYLKLNKDVTAICGENYTCAIEHWVTIGHEQNKKGIIQGLDGHYTLSNVQNSVHYSVYTPRYGSAVHSVIYKNREMANAWDHGRGIQYSITMDQYGECFNPVEAGGSYDGIGPATHSKLKAIHVNDSLAWQDYLYTSESPSFWLSPGSTSSTKCGKAVNQQFLSNWTITKNIQIEIFVNRYPFRILERVSRWWYKISSAPMNASNFVLQSPMMHANAELTKMYTYNVMYQKLSEVTAVRGTSEDPVVIASEDGTLATAGYITVGSYRFDRSNLMGRSRPWMEASSMWSVVANYGEDVKQGEEVDIITYMVVGTLDEVTDDLITLGGLLRDGLLG